MKNSFESSLLESGELIKRGASVLVANVGKVIAVITVFVSVLVLFTDISFRDFGAESFTSTMAVMLIASYLMYFSMSDTGESRGEESDEYKAAEKRCSELSAKVGGDMIGELREFCKSYSEKELEYRRLALIMSLGYGENEYSAYKRGEACDKKAARAFKKADRLKAISITPKVLLSKEHVRGRSELINPESSKIFTMLLKLIPMTLCMTVTVSIMLTAKENLDTVTVIDGIFKLSSLPIVGFKGYASGYSYTKRTLPLWLDTKSRLLDAFLKSRVRS